MKRQFFNPQNIYFIFFIFNNQLFAQTDQCGIKKCLDCNYDQKICLKCDGSLIFDRQSGECQRRNDQLTGTYIDFIKSPNDLSYCHPSCNSCVGNKSSDCLECADGYYSIFDQENNLIQCQMCEIDNCIRCDAKNVCKKCKNGFSYNADLKQCIQCKDSNCFDCSQNYNICQKCNLPFTINLTTQLCELKKCVKGKYLQLPDKCLSCHKSCESCFNSQDDSCYQCSQRYFFDSSNRCIQCDSSCNSCKEFSKNCTSCRNRCVQNCMKGYYVDNQVCKPCLPECSECTSLNFCKSCLDNSLFSIKDGICKKKCEKDEFVLLSTEDQNKWLNKQYDQMNLKITQCKKCSKICQTCILQENNCTSCKENYYLFKNKCLLNCPSGYYKLLNKNNQLICQLCPYPCSDCSSSGQCLECLQGFSLRSDGKCGYDELVAGQCTEDQYQFQSIWYKNNQIICFNQCPIGSIVIGRRCFCQKGCKECKFDKFTYSIICVKCQNTNEYSQKDICVAKCSSLFFQQENPTKICQPLFCQNPQLRLVELKGRQCVKDCPNNYTFMNGTCSQVQCQNGQYFDNQLYQEAQANKQNDLNLQLYCKSCHNSCENCVGPTAFDCIQCKQNSFFQPSSTAPYNCSQNCESKVQNMSISTLPDSHVFQIVCMSCKEGQKWLQIDQVDNTKQYKCLTNPKCSINEKEIMIQDTNNNYSLVCKKQKQCPYGTKNNYLTDTCELNVEKFHLDLDEKKKQGSKYSYLNGLSFKFSYDFSLEFLVNSINLNGQQLSLNQNVQSVYEGILMPEYFETLTNQNNLKIDFQIEKQNYSISKTFQILKIVQGIFSINPSKGQAEKDDFSIIISDYLIDGLHFDQYNLTYQVFTEYKLNSKIDKQNITLFIISQSQLQDNTSKPLKLNLSIKFPNIQLNSIVSVYLKVFNDLVEYYDKVEIQLSSYQYPEDTKTISPILNYTVNRLQLPFDKNQKTIWNGSILTQKLILNNIIQKIDNLQNTLLKQEKLMSNTVFLRLGCDTDCNNNGECVTRPVSYYNRCQCYENFIGEVCQWSKPDLQYLKELYDTFFRDYVSEFFYLQRQNPFNFKRFSDNILFLIKIADFRDYFDTINKVNDFLEKISDGQIYECLEEYQMTGVKFEDFLVQAEYILTLLDKAFDLISRLTPSDMNTKLAEKIVDNISKVLSITMKFKNQFKQNMYRFNATFISASIHLVVKGENQFQALDFSYNVEIDSSSLEKYYYKDAYIQLISFPFVNQKKIDDQKNFQISASKIVELSFFDKNTFFYEKIKLFTEKVTKITLPHYANNIDQTQKNFSYQIVCGFQITDLFVEKSFVINSETAIGTIGQSTCQTNTPERIAVFITSIPENKDDEQTDITISSESTAQFILTLCSALIILCGGFVISIIMSRVKIFSPPNRNQQYIENNEQNQQQQQFVQGQQNNEGIAQSSLQEGLAIIQDQQFAVEGQIIEEGNNRFQRRRQGRFKDLPINQIEIDIEIQNDKEIVQDNSQNQENKGDISNINMGLTHKEEIFVSQDNVIRAANNNNNQTLVVNTQIDVSFNTKSKIKSNNFIKSNSHIGANNQQKANNIQVGEQQQEIEIPQGIPINDVRQKLKKYQDERIKKACSEQEHHKQIAKYHPLKSFSDQLQYVSVSVRVIIFFSYLALFEWMCIASYFEVSLFVFYNEEIQVETASFTSTVIRSIIMKNLLQYAVPLAYFLLASFEKLIINKSIIFEGNVLKYIFLTTLSVYSIYRINAIAKYLPNSQIGSFVSILCTSIGIDFIIIDCLFLYSLITIKRCQYLIKLVKLKNFDYKV